MLEIFAATAFICTITDITYGKIFNLCTLPAIAAGSICRVADSGLRAVPSLLLSMVLPWLLLWPFRRVSGSADRNTAKGPPGAASGFLISSQNERKMRRGGIAGGDIKLLTALSVQLMPGEFLKVFAMSFAAAGVMAMVRLIRTKDPHASIPLAVPIGIAAAAYCAAL